MCVRQICARFRVLVSGELKKIESQIRMELKSAYPGLKGGGDRFGFRVYTEAEFQRLQSQGPAILIEN